MDIDELNKLRINDPKAFFELLERNDDNLNREHDPQWARLLVKEQFGLSENDMVATEFIYWISYYTERIIKYIISEVEKSKGSTQQSFEVVNFLLDSSSFWDKILVVEKFYEVNPKDSQFIKMLKIVKDFRNHVAHGRLDKLLYNDIPLWKQRGQIKLFHDLSTALLKK